MRPVSRSRVLQDVINSISKPKLPKTLAYALKTSQLEVALEDARIDTHVDLVYWTQQSGGSILEGQYWLPNENVSYPRVYVRAGSVAASQRAAASKALSTTGLPKFVEWLTGILELPHDSPKLAGTLYFNATFLDDRLIVSDTPHYKRRK